MLRHGLKTRNTRFSLCQFKPEHSLNPEVLVRYKSNICRIVPEVVYSAHLSHKEVDEATGNTKSAKRHRIDLVLFVNGLPVVTMELKSEFKQAVENAKLQYKRDRLPVDPASNKPEPLLSFKRGALVHFAVSQYDVFMTTRLAGNSTYFLPFNKGTREGGAGNNIPEDQNRYATDYLWNEVLSTDNLLDVLGLFMHLQIEEVEDALGRKDKKETMIFPRYHQWDVVTNLIEDAVKQDQVRQAKQQDPNLAKKVQNRYLIQHSAGSGKSNSIAWTAHQLSTLYNDAVLIGNAENELKEAKKDKDALVLFKKDLGSFARFYEFMSQIVDYDDRELEKLSLYARHLLPLLREDFNPEDDIDLSNIEMTHYRVSKLRQQDLKLQESTEEYQLEPAGLGTATPKDKKEDYLSEIIRQLNDVFAGEGFTDSDIVSYAETIRDKMAESEIVMTQVRNNTKDQAMLGDFPIAIDDAMIDSREAHEKMMMHIFSDKKAHSSFSNIIYDMLADLSKRI